MATDTEAWLEEMATPNEGTIVTLELQHSTFDVPARIVANVGDDLMLGIEVGAAIDGGATVTFIACPLKADPPEYRPGLPPSTKVTIDNVNRDLWPKVELAMTVREYLKVIYREYLPSDPSAPCYGPIEFLLKDVTMDGPSLQGTATVAMLTNKGFPRLDKNYDPFNFPSLLPG